MKKELKLVVDEGEEDELEVYLRADDMQYALKRILQIVKEHNHLGLITECESVVMNLELVHILA